MMAASDLHNFPLFGGLQKETIVTLIDQSKPHSRKQGELFFKQGDLGDSMHLILSGKVEVLHGVNDTHSLGYLKEGDCFGEMALIDHQPRSASVRALEDTHTLEISQDTLFNIYQKDVKQYMMLHMNMAREVSRRLRTTDVKVVY